MANKNTYLWDLGERREETPPWNWDDSPAQLGISPNMLNDPAFSEYDLSNIRTFEQDPLIRDAITLGDRLTELDQRYEQHGSAGYTFVPGTVPYDPNKVYVDRLNELKMAVGPGAEQAKQGAINKELASTISHEFRHNLFDQPEYSGIIDAAYNRFGGWEGNISRHKLEEYINRAADIQLMPESWLGETLEEYEDEYNKLNIQFGMPEHLTPMNTTKQFHRSAREFFEKVRRQKLKRPTRLNIRKQEIGMPEHLTPPPKGTYTPPRGGGADVMPIPPRRTVTPKHAPHPDRGGYEQSRGAPDRGRSRGKGETGQIAGGHHFSRGGYVDKALGGRNRDI